MPTPNVVPTPRPRTSRERAARDTEIFASCARGRPQAEVAAQHGLTVRQVQRILAGCRRDGLGAEWVDPVEEVRAVLELHAQAVADLAKIEENPDNNAAHIGATRLKLESAVRRLELMRDLGLLPNHLRTLRASDEMSTLFQHFADVLRRHNASDEMLTELEGLASRAAAVSAPVTLVRRVEAA